MRGLKCVSLLVSLLWVTSAAAQVPTAATATISGTVTDPTGAVVPDAEVVLVDLATNATRSAKTNTAGQYAFVNVVPGVYKLTVTAQGFRQAVMPSLKVDVAKSYLANIPLAVGSVAEVVEVTAGVGVELQTTDATVGNVLKGDELRLLPSANRSAVALLYLQPMVMPYRGVGVNDNVGGQVAGARSDQSTFSIDGADATDNTVGTHPVKPSEIGVEPIIPVPTESIEEFRVGTTNPNATFGRSSGGQFAFVTKRGTNDLHGSFYWYHQNDNLNANTWTRKRLGKNPLTGRDVVSEPELKDNRYGLSAGGPIAKDRTFIFGHFEGRRFPRAADVARLVPTASLRAGTLRFTDASLVTRDYPLASSTLCGPTNSSLCDPRSLGLSPVINTLWNLLPPGNDGSLGDGLNTIGFRSTADTSIESDFAVARLDHVFNDKWRFDSSFRYYRHAAKNAGQVDIGGLLPGDTLGQAASTRSFPVQPRYLVAGLTGQVTPRLTNEFRFAWLRDWWWINVATPFPQVAGTNVALQVAGNSGFGGLVDEPIDVHTQLARTQGVNSKNFQFTDNATLIRGKHTLQFGGSVRHILLFHLRNDKVVGSLSALVAEVDDAAAVTIPLGNRPPDCTLPLQPNCLTSGDVTRWNRLFAGVTGMIDNIGVMIVRDGSLNARPIGTALEMDTKNDAFEFYASDTWRPRPSLTLTAGFSYQWQTPPVEKLGRNTFMVDSATGEILTTELYLERRRQAALAGSTYNPTLGFQPLLNSGRNRIFDIDRSNFGPRVAASWNPSYQSGVLGRLFGDRKSVLRGGYSVVYDRLNTVQTVVIPLLGVGFAQTINCRGPRSTGTCGNTNDPSNAFRIGVDGPAPIPPIPAVTSPVIPSSPFGELLSFQIDPDITVGRSHSLDFTIQREVPGNMLLEIGYAGRLGRNLNQNKQVSAVPFFMVSGGQSLAQAFDAVATEIRNNQPVTPQPWFETQLGAGGTATIAAIEAASFRDGQLSNLWTTLQFLLPSPLGNLQVLDLWMRTDGGRSNYHGGFVTLRKRLSHGLTFDVNYTYSKALDQAGLIQNFIGTFSSSYDPDIDYGPAFFDRRHVWNSVWFYELPFGRGRKWATGNWLDKLTGGWSIRGIFTANSGLPLTVTQSFQAWGGDPLDFSVASGAIPVRKTSFGNSVHSGVIGSATGGISAGCGTTGAAISVGTNSNPSGIPPGSGLNLFADPAAVFNSFRKICISQDARSGRGVLRGLPRWLADISFGKTTAVTETTKIIFSLDFLNAFNRVEFADPSLSFLAPRSFGVLTTQFNAPRAIQFGLRVEF